MRTLLAALAMFATSGAWIVEDGSEPALVTVQDRALADPPISAELTYPSQRSKLGWGNFDLSADPDYDEIHVNLLLGTPTDQRHFDRCPTLELDIDGRRESVETHYAGVPMRNGVFDAVTAELNILQVRAMATARIVRAELCGEYVELDEEGRRHLRDFVQGFDALGVYDGPSFPKPPRELGPEHEWEDPTPSVDAVEA